LAVVQLSTLGVSDFMTNQQIGALLDKAFFIGAGLFMLFVSPKILRKNMAAEEKIRVLKILRICGIGLILCGIISFILM
jgi:hypothetical protein